MAKRKTPERHLADGTVPDHIDTWEEMLDWIAAVTVEWTVKDGDIRADGVCPVCGLANALLGDDGWRRLGAWGSAREVGSALGLGIAESVVDQVVAAADGMDGSVHFSKRRRRELMQACGLA